MQTEIIAILCIPLLHSSNGFRAYKNLENMIDADARAVEIQLEKCRGQKFGEIEHQAESWI